MIVMSSPILMAWPLLLVKMSKIFSLKRHQFTNRHIKCCSQFSDIGQTNIDFTALNMAHVITMKPRQFR